MLEAPADRVVPIVIFLRGGPNERRLQLGSEQTDYLNFHFIAVELTAMPYNRWRDSDNIVARINLPNMRHPRHARVEVFAAAIQGLIALEQDPEKTTQIHRLHRQLRRTRRR